MGQLLVLLGFELDARSHRCSCLLHRGRNRTAFSWREDGRWFCHSCGLGGDRIALVMALKKCGFSDAVAFLATIAGVPFSIRRRPDTELRRLAKKRERLAEIAWHLRDAVVSLRSSFRDRLLRTEQLQWISGEHLRAATAPEVQEYYWGVLARLAPLVAFFLASFSFLNSANTATLIIFAKAPHSAQRKMILEGLV